MDSNDLERERGITILAKNTAIRYKVHSLSLEDIRSRLEHLLCVRSRVRELQPASQGDPPVPRPLAPASLTPATGG